MMTLEKFYKEHSDNKTRTDWIDGYREEWMSDDQWLCAIFLCRLFNGFHHIYAPIKAKGRGIEINTRHSYFSTFDYDYLTKAVIMAHNWGVRLEVSGSGPGMIKISLWKRHSRDGNISDRHPDINDAVEKYKNY